MQPLQADGTAMPHGDSLSRRVVIANPQGLHLRPAAAFAQLAARFQSAVVVSSDERQVNGKSLWDLIGLAVPPGAAVTLEVTGDDAHEALPLLADVLAAEKMEEE